MANFVKQKVNLQQSHEIDSEFAKTKVISRQISVIVSELALFSLFPEFTIFLENSLKIHSKFTQNSHREFSTNSRDVQRIRYEFRQCYAINQLSLLRIYYESTIFIADSSRIHLMFQELTLNSLSIQQSYFEFTFYLRILQ